MFICLYFIEIICLYFSTGITGIIGGFAAGIISDRYGRQLPFLIGMVFIALFGVVSAFAPSYPLFIVFRCMVTIGTGTFESVGFVLLLGKFHLSTSYINDQNVIKIDWVVLICGNASFMKEKNYTSSVENYNQLLFFVEKAS